MIKYLILVRKVFFRFSSWNSPSKSSQSRNVLTFRPPIPHTGSVALQSPDGGRSQLLHRGPRPRGHAPPWDREGPVWAHSRSQGAHHGAGPHHPGDRALQSRCLQQGQKSHGLLRPEEVSSLFASNALHFVFLITCSWVGVYKEFLYHTLYNSFSRVMFQ